MEREREKKSRKSERCTSGVLAGLGKRKCGGDVLTAQREEVGTKPDTINMVCVSLAQLALSRVSNVIWKAGGGLRWLPDIMQV